MALASSTQSNRSDIGLKRVVLMLSAALSGLGRAARFMGRAMGSAVLVQGVSPASLG
ncbi:MAG: hypothetical protein V3V35_02290 [Dehalococcoidia bacterium]